MDKLSRNVFNSIIAPFIIVLLVPFPLLGANGACVTYSSSSRTITVGCTSETHLNDVNNAINDPTILKKESNGVWLLAANLVVAKGGNLVIDPSDASWLKIISNGAVGYGLKNSGNLKIDTVKITSWNTASNTYASPGSDGTTPRGYIVASGGGVGKMNIFNSELAYLGYHGSGHHGLDYYGSDGSIIQGNHIHHNWRAFYSSGVGGILFDRNEVHDNLEYGIDPHSGTHDMTITNNKSYNNNHGIICSQKCYNIHIENNELYANSRDGIFLDAGSHHSTIANNIIYQEEVAIQIGSLSYSKIYGNTISESTRGIKLHTQIGSTYDQTGGCGDIGCGSTNNHIHDNKITASSTGIEIMEGAASNTIESNTISGAGKGRAIVVDGSTTSNNIIKNNEISSSPTGMMVAGANKDSTFSGNRFSTTSTSGEYTLQKASTLKLENTVFSADVIRALDTTSNPVSISKSGPISVVDGVTGKTTNHDTTNQAYTRTLASNAKITVTSTTTGTPADTTPPAQVTGLSVSTVSSTQLNLAWTQSSASDFNHYNVYRGTSSGFSVNPSTTTPIGTTIANSYSSTGLNPSTKYYYKVAAVDNAGNIGALSSENSGTTAASSTSTDKTPPAQVSGLVISTVSSSQLNLAWTGSSASDFNHYNIYRSTTSGFTVTPGITVPTGTSTTSSYSNTGLNPSTTYSYRVAAVDNAGNIGPLSAQVSKTTATSSTSTDKTPPAQVSGLVISTVSSSQLNLAWTGSSASDFNHYNIYRSTTSGFTVTPGITVPTGTSTTSSYSNTGLNPSTTYSYRVAAVDNAGNIGPLSAQVSKTTAASSTSTDNTPPAQVTGLVVRTLSSTELNLVWSRVIASDFNHYNIYRGTSGFTVTPGITVPTGTSTTSSYSNTGLNPSTTYSYRVAAVDNAGNIGPLSAQVSKTTATALSTTQVSKTTESALSTTNNVDPLSSEKSRTTGDNHGQGGGGKDITPPGRVGAMSIKTISHSQLDLKWSPVKDSDLNHYNIYIGTSYKFSVKPGATPPIDTSTATSYHSTGLNPSTKYYYKVAAVDNAGNIGPLSSMRSGETGDAPGSKVRTSETAVTTTDTIIENSNMVKPTQDDREGPTKEIQVPPDSITDVDPENNTGDGSPSIDLPKTSRG